MLQTSLPRTLCTRDQLRPSEGLLCPGAVGKCLRAQFLVQNKGVPLLLRSQLGVWLGRGCSSHTQLWGALCSPGCPWEGVECKVNHIQMEGHREPEAEALGRVGAVRRLCLATRVKRGQGMAGEGPGTMRACPDPGDGISWKMSST